MFPNIFDLAYPPETFCEVEGRVCGQKKKILTPFLYPLCNTTVIIMIEFAWLQSQN